jgi:hypothetical protein
MGTPFGFREVAADITASTAEHEWCHLPGAPRANRRLLPVAPRLLLGYDAEIALAGALAAKGPFPRPL